MWLRHQGTSIKPPTVSSATHSLTWLNFLKKSKKNQKKYKEKTQLQFPCPDTEQGSVFVLQRHATKIDGKQLNQVAQAWGTLRARRGDRGRCQQPASDNGRLAD